MSDIAQGVKAIVADQLGVDEKGLVETDSFIDDLGADSLDRIEIVLACEEDFGIGIPDEDADRLSTVEALIEYVERVASQRQST